MSKNRRDDQDFHKNELQKNKDEQLAAHKQQKEALKRERVLRERREAYERQKAREREEMRRERERIEQQRIEEIERREEERRCQEQIERDLYMYTDNDYDGYDDDGFWH